MIFKKLPFIIFIFCTLLLSNCSNKKTYENLMDSCFIIKASTEGKVDSFGTCFLINNKTVITNSHIITYKEYGENFTHENISLSSNEISYDLKIIENNIKKDFAILEFLVQDSNNNLNPLSFDINYIPILGDSIFTIGNLNNYGLSVNFGHISSKEKIIESSNIKNNYVQTDIEISPGSSGGPVFNSNNLVIGIMTLKLRDNNGEYVDGASFYLPLDVFKDKIS